jgi:RNA polymerase sigma-70 factor (ECF subfamily)
VIGGETRIGIIEAVWRLSLKHREVVLLRYIEEKKVFEIAAFLSISEGTVKSRLHYALRRLRENLGAESATVTRPAENIDEM